MGYVISEKIYWSTEISDLTLSARSDVCVFIILGSLYSGHSLTGRSLLVPFNLLSMKHNPLYVSNQSVPRCKLFPPPLQKPIS